MRSTMYTEQQKKEVVEKISLLRKQGKSFTEAVDETGVPKGTVYPWIRKYSPHDVPPKRAYAPRKRKEKEVELIQIPQAAPETITKDNQVLLFLVENIETQLNTIKKILKS